MVARTSSPLVGRQRQADNDTAILDAALEILSAVGYEGLTIEAVARRAGVGRPTVYRRWSTKASLALAAVARATGTPPTPDSGDLRSDLVALQRHQMALMNSSLFRTVAPALTAHFASDSGLAASYVRDFVDLRRSVVCTVLDRAVDRGEPCRNVDQDLIYDALTGPLFYRAIARGERLNRRFVEAIVDIVVCAFAAPEPGPVHDTSRPARRSRRPRGASVGGCRRASRRTSYLTTSTGVSESRITALETAGVRRRCNQECWW